MEQSAEEIMELQKQNCIFCKIINGEIPSHEVFSDDKVKVILDINPANEGHCLILPKEHYQILPQIPGELISHMFLIAKRASRTMLRALGVKGTSIFVANGAMAGQKSPHFMIHVIPRQRGDMMFDLPKSTMSEEELNEILSKMQVALSGQPQQTQRKPVEEKKEPEKEEKVEEKKQKDEDVDLDRITEMFDK